MHQPTPITYTDWPGVFTRCSDLTFDCAAAPITDFRQGLPCLVAPGESSERHVVVVAHSRRQPMTLILVTSHHHRGFDFRFLKSTERVPLSWDFSLFPIRPKDYLPTGKAVRELEGGTLITLDWTPLNDKEVSASSCRLLKLLPVSFFFFFTLFNFWPLAKIDSDSGELEARDSRKTNERAAQYAMFAAPNAKCALRMRTMHSVF